MNIRFAPNIFVKLEEGTNMAVDIKKMVDTICSLTVLELSKLVKALRDKFGLGAKDGDQPKSIPEPKPLPEPDVEPVLDPEPLPEPLPEPKPEPESRSEEIPLVPDPSSVPDPGPLSQVRNSLPVKRPEVEDFAFVYAWRYSGSKRFAKIGKTTRKSFYSRFIKTYHPTDDPILIGIFECNNEPHALKVETYLLQELERTRPDVQGHEWVKIDEAFNKMIDNSFLSDPNELEKIFGSGIRIEGL